MFQLKKILLITTVFICVFLFCGSASAAGSWNNETVAKGNFTHVSLSLNSTGDPCISYYDTNKNALEYAYKFNGKWINKTVANGNIGESSLALDKNNNPSISYYDVTDDVLRYAYITNGIWTNEIVDNGGVENTLAMDKNNNPCIVYLDSNSNLYYATEINGTWSTSWIDGSGTKGSLAIDSHNTPCVVEYNTWDSYLWYGYYTNGTWNYSPISKVNNVTSTSLVLNSQNRPYISFIDNGYLNYVYRNNGTWLIQNTTALNNVTHDSLSIDSKGNLVSTFDVNEGSQVTLVYAHQNYNYDATVWYCDSVDNATEPTTFQSSVKINSTNDPRIAYYNSNTNQLEYTYSTSKSSNNYYDLRNENRLPPVENQGKAGDCWTFATFGSLESCLLPNQTANFSENNLKDLSGFDIGWNDGGFYEMSTAYLVSWRGPVNAIDDPYNDTSGISPNNLTATAHVQNVLVLPVRKDPMDNDIIKTAIKNYGAVGTYMQMNDTYMDESTYGYYYNGKPTFDHAVDIVGWDDNYSRYNFNIVAPGDGAFIIRNSWGTDWADGGYFYVSYYDTSLGTEGSNKFSSDNFVFINAEQVNNYNKIYQYDPLGWTDELGYGTETNWMANIFNSTGNDQLAASSFYIPTMNSTYTLKVYTNVSAGKPTTGKLVETQRGTLNMGYWTINLNQLVPLVKNELFSIVLELTTPGNLANIIIQDQYPNYSSKATSAPNISFCSYNGDVWTDLNDFNAVLCLKAFTTILPPTVRTTDPLNNAIINTSNNVITITFTEPVQPGSAYDDISVTGPSGIVSVTKTINGNVLTLTSNSNFVDGNYNINIPVDGIWNLMGKGLISAFASNFTVDTIAPTVIADPAEGKYNKNKSVTLTATDVESTTIYYTTDGSDPQVSSTRNVYTNPIFINTTTTLRFIAVDQANNWSPEYTQSYTIIPLPVANFTTNTTSGTAPIKIQFNDTSSNNPTNWLWDFGDGTTSTLENPSHTYNRSGNYTVTLTVGNTAGENSLIKSNLITVNWPLPVAIFNYNVKNGTSPLNVQFTDNSTGDVTSWNWNFGDGTTSTLKNPNHIYSAAGTYTVTETVTGPGGSNVQISSIYVKTDTTPPTATASIKSGVYNTNQIIKLGMNQTGTIYYTLNGSTPTTASIKYTQPISVTSTCTLNFIAVNTAGIKSSVYKMTYTIDKIAPKVISTTPKNGATGISRTSTISIKFSENVKTGINWSKVYIKNLNTGKLITINNKISGNTLYIKPTKTLSSKNQYQVYIPKSALKDNAGNNVEVYGFKFKT